MDTIWLINTFRLTEPSNKAVRTQNSPRLCLMISASLLLILSRVLSIPQLNFSLHCFESLWGSSSLRDVNRSTLALSGIRYRRINSYMAGQINGYGNVWLKYLINAISILQAPVDDPQNYWIWLTWSLHWGNFF